MQKRILRTYLNEYNQPFLAESQEIYTVERDDDYSNTRKIIELAIQLDCHRMAEENVFCLCLDNKYYPTGLFKISTGSIDSACFPVRELFQKALLLGAKDIVIWHNHPSGDPTPSFIDIRTTERCKEAGDMIGINIIDHIVIGRNNDYSIVQDKNIKRGDD